LVTIATQSEIGWRVKFDGSLTLEVFQGSDLSNQVQFSTDFDSLSNGQFTDSAEAYANTIYVGGKGTGSDRDIYEGEIENEGETPEGLERYEAWDNQSEMTSESEYEAEALSMLTQYGQTLNISGNGLAKCPYIFKEQYNIGDVITLAFSGKSAKAQILSVTEHWTWGQYGISFSFGKPQNDLGRQLQLILKQIQKASSKTETTSSVKYYTIPTDTEQPKADVIYDTIGFEGTCASGGSTFKLYYDSEKTGAKTYHVWFKQLGGGKLTLTTGVSGKANLVLNSGTYVAIIYVDAEGNVLSQGATATNVIESGNTQPATSSGVSSAIDTVKQEIQTVESSLPTDAVLHYSFDELPDYPDGSADVRLLNNNTYDLQSTSYKLNNNGGTTFSNVNGNVVATIQTGNSSNGVRIADSQAHIFKIRIKVTNLVGSLRMQNGAGSASIRIATISNNGEFEYTFIFSTSAQYLGLYILLNDVASSATLEVEKIYIGNGSYSTPVIDNADGGNNAINNGGIATKGVSGKGAYFLNEKYASISDFNLTADFSVSVWVKPDNNTSGLNGNIVHKSLQFIIRNGATFGDYVMLYLYGEDSTLLNGRYLGTLLPPNIFTHIVVTREGTSCKVYKNGSLTHTFELDNSTLRQNANDMNIANSDNTRPQTIDDLLIFDRALTDTEVQALYLNKANTPKYYPQPTDKIEQNNWGLATSGGVWSEKYLVKNRKDLSSSAWYKIAEFGVRNEGSVLSVDLGNAYNYDTNGSHKIQITTGFGTANITDLANDTNRIFSKIRICNNVNNIDSLALYVNYRMSRQNSCFFKINAMSRRIKLFNFETDNLTWDNTVEYSLGTNGLYVNGSQVATS